MMEQLIPIGIITIFIGFFLLLIGSIFTLKGRAKTEGGFVVFLGPIPIVGASSKTMFYLMLILSIFLLIFSLFIIRAW